MQFDAMEFFSSEEYSELLGTPAESVFPGRLDPMLGKQSDPLAVLQQ